MKWLDRATSEEVPILTSCMIYERNGLINVSDYI